MKTIDLIHTLLVSVFFLLYLILVIFTKYRDPKKNDLTKKEKNLLVTTNIIGFIFGILFVSYEVRFLRNHMSQLARIFLLFLCITLVFIAYYVTVCSIDPNSFFGKLSNFSWPLFGAFVIICESMLNEALIQFRDDYLDESD